MYHILEPLASRVKCYPVSMSDLAATPHQDEETSARTAGQRRVNLLWEVTQSLIAMAVTSVTLYVSAQLALAKETAAALLLSNAFFLVIGFYFGRTNHQRIGGVGGEDAGR